MLKGMRAGDAAGLQVYFGLWVVLAAFCCQLVWRPYNNKAEQQMETVSLGAVLLSLLLGQGIATKGFGERDVHAIRVLAGLVNLFVLFYFSRVFIHELRLQVQESKAAKEGKGDDGSLGDMTQSAKFQEDVVKLAHLASDSGSGSGSGSGARSPTARPRGLSRFATDSSAGGANSAAELATHVDISGSSTALETVLDTMLQGTGGGGGGGGGVSPRSLPTIGIEVEGVRQRRQQQQQQQQQQGAPEVWMEVEDTEGRSFYFNPTTSASTTQMPRTGTMINRHASQVLLERHRQRNTAGANSGRRSSRQASREAGSKGRANAVQAMKASFRDFAKPSGSRFNFTNPMTGRSGRQKLEDDPAAEVAAAQLGPPAVAAQLGQRDGHNRTGLVLHASYEASGKSVQNAQL